MTEEARKPTSERIEKQHANQETRVKLISPPIISFVPGVLLFKNLLAVHILTQSRSRSQTVLYVPSSRLIRGSFSLNLYRVVGTVHALARKLHIDSRTIGIVV